MQGDASHGVLLAQGGNQRGYALHLDDGHLVFSVRSAGRLVSVRSPEMLPKEFRVEAVLAADASMRLTVNDKLVTTGQAAALIAMEPIDGLSIGEDSESDVADYGDRERFDGQVSNIDITAERVPLTHAAHAVPAPLFADPHYPRFVRPRDRVECPRARVVGVLHSPTCKAQDRELRRNTDRRGSVTRFRGVAVRWLLLVRRATGRA